MTSVGGAAKQREKEAVVGQNEADGIEKEECVKYEGEKTSEITRVS